MNVIAKILLLVLFVIIFAAIGAAVIFLGVLLIGAITGASNINGGLAMGAASMTPMGGLLGAIAGLWFGWRAITRWTDQTIKRTSFGILLFVALAVGAWFLQSELTDGNPYTPGEEPVVLIEWQLPELFPHDQVKPVFRRQMRSSYMDWPLDVDWADPPARDEAGKTILRFEGEIRWRVTGRIFQLWRYPQHNARITVDLRLPRKPALGGPFSEWHQVEEPAGHAFRTKVLAPG